MEMFVEKIIQVIYIDYLHSRETKRPYSFLMIESYYI